METGVMVTIAIFILGVTFHSGRLSVRVEHLEEWRCEFDDRLEKMLKALGNIEDAVNARKNP